MMQILFILSFDYFHLRTDLEDSLAHIKNLTILYASINKITIVLQLNFENFRCSSYWTAILKRGKDLFQSKKKFSYENFPYNNKKLAL